MWVNSLVGFLQKSLLIWMPSNFWMNVALPFLVLTFTIHSAKDFLFTAKDFEMGGESI